MGIAYSYKRGIVTVTADDGTTRDWPLATFEASPASCVAQTGNGIAPPPPPEPTPDEKIAAVRAELQAALDAEKAKVANLETFIAGNADPAAPDARTDIKAIINALKAENILTDEKIDAQRRSSYRDNGDGTISMLDKFGKPTVTFDPSKPSPDQAMYATWLSMGGKPLPPDATAMAEVAVSP